MAKELSTATRNQTDATFMPDWLVSKVTEVVKTGSLTEAQKLTLQERQWAEAELSVLSPLLASPMAQEGEVIAEVGRFLLAHANGSISEDTAKAKAYSYWIALEDIPVWALRAAIRRWHRGEVHTEVNYAWPQSHMLRAAALEVMQLAEHKRYCLNALLQASEKPSPEVFSDEHRKTMLGKIAGLFSNPGKTKAAFQK